MNQVNEMSFRDLISTMEELATKFFLAKKIHDIKTTDSIAEFSFNDNYPYDLFLSKVEGAYKSLNEAEQNLINNEFFYQSYSNWWETIYSKATFYRYKKEAMQKFLGAFYEA